MAEPSAELEVTGIVGNGRLLAGFDVAGALTTLTAPHIDYPQHVRFSRLGVSAASRNARVRWLNRTGWRHQQDYLRGSNVLRTRSADGAEGLTIEQRAAAVDDALLLGITFVPTAQSESVWLTWHIGFQIGGQPMANGLVYSPSDAALVAYYREHALAITGVPTIEEVQVQSTGATHGGVSKGGHDPLATVGEVSARVRMELQPGGLILLIISYGQPSAVVAQLGEVRARINVDGPWPVELDQPPQAPASLTRVPPVGDLDRDQQAAVTDCYTRSILTIAQLTDRSGAVIAGPSIDPRFLTSGGYAYCWPRDGAFIACALDVVGERGASRAFFDWVLARTPEDGIWRQRYYADGLVGPCWTDHQLDETGTVLWALDRHLQASSDGGLAAEGLRVAVRSYETIARLAGSTGWPPCTQNLWEDQLGSHLYTLAALLAGAGAWRRRAELSEDEIAARLLGEAETRLRDALAGWPVDPETGAFARARVATAAAAEPLADFTADASLLGISVPFEVLPTDDGRVAATVRVLQDRLATATGRILRYAGDRYQGGNAWPLCELWLAWHHLRVGNRAEGVRLYQNVLGDRSPAGMLAEQVDVHTGQPRWVLPLPWAHAWFLLVTHALSETGPS